MGHNEFIKCPCILIQTQVNQTFVSCSFANSCLNLHDSMDCSTAGFPVLPYLSEFAQTHVHWVDDAIQPSYPRLPPSPPVLSLSQYHGLFQWVDSSHQVAKVLDLQLQHSSEYSGLISFRIDWFDFLTIQGTLESLLLHHRLKPSIFLVLNLLCDSTLTSLHDYWKNHSFDYMDLFWQSDTSAF